MIWGYASTKRLRTPGLKEYIWYLESIFAGMKLSLHFNAVGRVEQLVVGLSQDGILLLKVANLFFAF